MHTESFKQKRKFIVKLGKMLHKYGTPVFRLEAHLMEVANELELRSSYIISPTSMTFVIWTEGHEDEYTHAARVQPGDLDLGSLSRTDDVVKSVLSGDLSVEEASDRLDEIDNMPNPYGKISTGLSFIMASSAFILLMGATAVDVFWSGVLGLVVYIFVLWSGRSKGITKMLEPLVALVSAFIACGISAKIDPSLNTHLVILSAIIVFIPGLALTIGLAELSMRHLVSGTAKTMDALMMLFKLYFGAYLGIALGNAAFGTAEFQPQTLLPSWTVWIAITVLCISLVIAFRMRTRHIIWAMVSGYLAYISSTLGAVYFDYGIGAFIGAFVVGVYGSIFTRVALSPAVIVTMHGLIVLVPGSKTFIGLNSYVTGQGFALGDVAGQQSLVILMSLVAGLIFANSALPPKKSL